MFSNSIFLFFAVCQLDFFVWRNLHTRKIFFKTFVYSKKFFFAI